MIKKLLYVLCVFFLIGCEEEGGKKEEGNMLTVEVRRDGLSEIYLAGGCFWGMQGYFKRVKGVVETEVGYANGKTENASYQDLQTSDHAETLLVVYDSNIIRLQELLLRFFKIIDPTSLNKQGNDIGRQYRTGIYYKDETTKLKVDSFISFIQKKVASTIVVEVETLRHFIRAEEYHQDYLGKNPGGYCHIDLSLATIPLHSDLKLKRIEKSKLREQLTDEQYRVTQQKDTEKPFTSEYDKFDEKGIYVDIVTGKPLFASQDKYDAGCGWPSFTRPITTDAIDYTEDKSYGMTRTEVTTSNENTHLGHVFNDGIKEKGGLRYCINGSSLRFIPYNEMEEEGYGDYMIFIE